MKRFGVLLLLCFLSSSAGAQTCPQRTTALPWANGRDSLTGAIRQQACMDQSGIISLQANVISQNGIVYADRQLIGQSGADAGARIAAAVSALPSTGGVVDARGLTGSQTISTPLNITKDYVEVVFGRGNYTVSAQIKVTGRHVHLTGQNWGSTVLTSGLTGVPADSMILVDNTDYFVMEGIALVGAANTGHLLQILNSSGGANGLHTIRDCTFGNSTGTGKDYAGVGVPAAGVYVRENNEVRLEHDQFFGNDIHLYVDNTGVPVTGVNASGTSSCDFNNATSDAVYIPGGGSYSWHSIGDHYEQNGGYGINANILYGSYIGGGGFFEANALGSINLTGYTQGTVIQGNTFALRTDQGPGITFSSTGLKGVGNAILDNHFNIPNVAAGTLAKAISADFVGSRIENNTVAAVATITVTDFIKMEAGSTRNFISNNSVSTTNAGTVTNLVNDSVLGTLLLGTGLVQPPFLGNGTKSWTVGGANAGLMQATNNTNLGIYSKGTGKIFLNPNGGGTTGTDFGDGGGNVVATVNSTGVGSFNGGLIVGSGTLALKHLSGTASLDFTALAANTCEVLTVNVAGAADGDSVYLGVPNALADVDGATERTTFFAWVSGAGVVSVRRCNVTAAATANPGAATVRVDIWQY